MKQFGYTILGVSTLLLCWQIGEFAIGEIIQNLFFSIEKLSIVETIVIGCSSSLLAVIGFLVALLTLNNQAIVGKSRDILIRLASLTMHEKTYNRETSEKVQIAVTEYKIISRSVQKSSIGRYKSVIKLMFFFVGIAWYSSVLLLSANTYHPFILVLKVLVSLMIYGLVRCVLFFDSTVGLGGVADLPSYDQLVDGAQIKCDVRTVDLLASSLSLSFRTRHEDHEQYVATVSGIMDIKNVEASLVCNYYTNYFEDLNQKSAPTKIKWENTAKQKMLDFMHVFSPSPGCERIGMEIHLTSKEGCATVHASFQVSDLKNMPSGGISALVGKQIPVEINVSYGQ